MKLNESFLECIKMPLVFAHFASDEVKALLGLLIAQKLSKKAKQW